LRAAGSYVHAGADELVCFSIHEKSVKIASPVHWRYNVEASSKEIAALEEYRNSLSTFINDATAALASNPVIAVVCGNPCGLGAPNTLHIMLSQHCHGVLVSDDSLDPECRELSSLLNKKGLNAVGLNVENTYVINQKQLAECDLINIIKSTLKGERVRGRKLIVEDNVSFRKRTDAA